MILRKRKNNRQESIETLIAKECIDSSKAHLWLVRKVLKLKPDRKVRIWLLRESFVVNYGVLVSTLANCGVSLNDSEQQLVFGLITEALVKHLKRQGFTTKIEVERQLFSSKVTEYYESFELELVNLASRLTQRYIEELRIKRDFITRMTIERYFIEKIKASKSWYENVLDFMNKQWYNRGMDATSLDDKITAYSEAIRFSPNCTESYNNRGIAYVEKGLHDTAIADFDQAVQIDPNYTPAYSNRGIALCKTGKYLMAIANFKRALQIDPNYVEGYINRGIALTEKGHYDAAIADFDQALRINPNLVDAYFGRGLAYSGKGDKYNARQSFQKAQELGHPGAQEVLDLLE